MGMAGVSIDHYILPWPVSSVEMILAKDISVMLYALMIR